ncbi:MAG: hypothetical protein RL226_2082 [Bacteroidota bacterium]|jgi:hypothetical protein
MLLENNTSNLLWKRQSFGCLFSFILLFAGLQVNAQIHAIKLNAAAAAFGSIAVSYEHVQKKQYGWQFTLTYRPKLQGPEAIFSRTEPGWTTAEASSSMAGAQISRRWYTNKARRNPAKPYIALFAQSQLWKANVVQTYEDTRFFLDGTWNSHLLGLQFGTQWVIGERLCVDATFVGFGIAYNQLNASGIATSSGLAGLWEENLANIPAVGSKLLLEGADGQYAAKANYLGVGLHSALRIGWLF